MARKATSPRIFVPLTKVDEEQRLVYGTISQELVDKADEMMDYELSKPNFEKWSNDIHTASGGLSKGNLRVMHGLTVAGKLTEMGFNDEEKSVEVCSKVVDDNEWNKVLEGCYTGFSVGGKYGKKWKETIDGKVIQKFEAIPNEVSLVDNPCLPSATFSLVKADGAEEQVMFKAAQEGSDEDSDTEDTENTPENKEGTTEDPPAGEGATTAAQEPSNEDVAKRATEMAKAAGDGSAWVNHIEAARQELMKAVGEEPAPEEDDEEDDEDKKAAKGKKKDDEEDEATDETVEKVTPPGVNQVWRASDGQTFEKKADAEAHEEKLSKTELTDAEKLRQRLEKATSEDPVDEGIPLMEDFDRLAKVVSALSTPFEDGQPKLEKGMYTVNRFSNVLSDMASVARCIKNEGTKEGGDPEDAEASSELMDAVKVLGKTFIDYATNQVTELLAGLDDDVLVSYHDYYYAAHKEDGENALAKDVCDVINQLREPAKETRETLAKAFGAVVGEELETELSDELSPPMQKRFDELKAESEAMTKVATEAVEKLEELSKRLKHVEDTPMPRAPNANNIISREGDGTFLGKSASTVQEKVAIIHDMVKEIGPDAMATMLIKASHETGGVKMGMPAR